MRQQQQARRQRTPAAPTWALAPTLSSTPGCRDWFQLWLVAGCTAASNGLAQWGRPRGKRRWPMRHGGARRQGSCGLPVAPACYSPAPRNRPSWRVVLWILRATGSTAGAVGRQSSFSERPHGCQRCVVSCRWSGGSRRAAAGRSRCCSPSPPALKLPSGPPPLPDRQASSASTFTM